MWISSDAELAALRGIGRIVRLGLEVMTHAVQPGVSTAELSCIGERLLAAHGAESSPPKVYGFPGAVCISVNEEAIHGIPSHRTLKPGDLVKLDLTAEKNGFIADAAVTIPVEPISDTARRLIACAQRAFAAGASSARSGHRVYEIGRAVEREVRKAGFSVMRALSGHGVGRTIHEEPSVPNYMDKRAKSRLKEGLVITIEPIIAAGAGRERQLDDGWTVTTADGSLSAHFEHTIVITSGQPIVITAAD